MSKKQVIFLYGIFLLACINLFYVVWFFMNHRYLPAPFVYDKENTFMDFYNTLYWSGRDGIYSVWESVYPPLSFLFLQGYQILFTDDLSRFTDGFDIRHALGSDIFPLLGIYIASLLISVGISFRSMVDRKTQVIIFLIFLISPPFLFALERGNLIILSLPILSWFIFTTRQISKAMALAILINLKPYFVIFYVIQLLNVKTHKEQKDFLFLAPVFTAIIFLSTGLLLGQEFYLMPINLLGFATNRTLLSPSDVLSFPSSLASYAYLRGLITEFSIPSFLGYFSKAIIYLYLIKSALVIFKAKVDCDDLAIFSVIFITNYSISTGGYGILYYIPIIAILYKQKYYAFISFNALIFVGIWDLIPIYRLNSVVMDVYLSSEKIQIDAYIGFGSILRPLFNLCILILFFANLKNKYLNDKIKIKTK